jgi:hypothetical protein
MRDGQDVVVLLPGAAIDPDRHRRRAHDLRPARGVDGDGEAGQGRRDRARAIDADVHGEHARFEGDADKQCIGFWTDEKDFVTWELELPAPARLDVAVEYACPPETPARR